MRSPEDNVAEYAITIEDVQRAAETIQGKVLRTPLVPAPRLSQLTGATVFVKHENMQPTGSFKERGAATKLESLEPAERARGVIAMSAGNHAQAVAYHARRLGIPATIVMPEGTPLVKAENTRSYGAQGHPGRRDALRIGGPCPRDRRRGRARLRPPLRRPEGHGGPGHHRPRNARAMRPISTRSSCPSAAAG